MREKTWVDKWIFTLKAMIFLGVDSHLPEANMYLKALKNRLSMTRTLLTQSSSTIRELFFEVLRPVLEFPP